MKRADHAAGGGGRTEAMETTKRLHRYSLSRPNRASQDQPGTLLSPSPPANSSPLTPCMSQYLCSGSGLTYDEWAITETSRQLDEGCASAQSCPNLFSPSLELLRSRLRDYCERLLFANPLGYGRKAEELLWRKGYYEVLAAAKRLKKDPANWSSLEQAYLRCHLDSGVGYYQHLVFRLQDEFGLRLSGSIDLPLVNNDYSVATQSTPANPGQQHEPGSAEWAEQSVHRSMLYLGDLCRYRLDLFPALPEGGPWVDLSRRYYLQALHLNPASGMPHNQMGTLSEGRNHSLDATYHYMRCIVSSQPFEGAELNLKRLFQRNHQQLEMFKGKDWADSGNGEEEVERCTVHFLALAEIFFLPSQQGGAPNKQIPQLCHEVLVDLQRCMIIRGNRGGEEDRQTDSVPSFLSDDMIFKMAVVALMCVWRLQEAASNQVSSAVAFTMAFFSQVVHLAVSLLQREDTGQIMEVVEVPPPQPPPPPTPPPVSKSPVNNPEQPQLQNGFQAKRAKVLAKLRRRRHRPNSSDDDDNDSSDISDESDDGMSQSDPESDMSESEDPDQHNFSGVSSDSESEAEHPPAADAIKNETTQNGDVEKPKVTAGMNGVVVPNAPEESVAVKQPSVPSTPSADLLSVVVKEDGLLRTIKVYADWLRGSNEILRACGQSSQTLMARMATLLNMLTRVAKARNFEDDDIRPDLLDKLVSEGKEGAESSRRFTLPEDTLTRGFPLLREAHKSLDWSCHRPSMNRKEEALARCHYLVSFGHFLSSVPETGVSHESGQFHARVLAEVNGTVGGKGKGGRNGFDSRQKRLMQSMAQLWLKEQVSDLENRVKRGAKGVVAGQLSPYLVVDVPALTGHLNLVRQLVWAKRFILIIPNTVVGSLDALKRTEQRARDAIRWLEAQFQRGHRFVRAQRQHERTPLPLLKYPRRRDKESWAYFQILECCNYFSQKGGVKDGESKVGPMVTLLSGSGAGGADAKKDDGGGGGGGGGGKGFSPVGLAQSAGVNLESIESFYSKWKLSVKSNG